MEPFGRFGAVDPGHPLSGANLEFTIPLHPQSSPHPLFQHRFIIVHNCMAVTRRCRSWLFASELNNLASKRGMFLAVRGDFGLFSTSPGPID